MLIPKADSRFFETPIKGQMPKNWANTILLTNMAENIIDRYSSITLAGVQTVEQRDKQAEDNERSRSQHKNQGAEICTVQLVAEYSSCA